MKDETDEHAFEYLINEFYKQGIVLTDIEEYNRQEHSKANDNSYIKYDGFLSVSSALDDKPAYQGDSKYQTKSLVSVDLTESNSLDDPRFYVNTEGRLVVKKEMFLWLIPRYKKSYIIEKINVVE